MSFLCTTRNKEVTYDECNKKCQYFFKIACIDKMNESYNQALEDFYNGLANELLWIKERFGDDAYTEAWCSVGCLKDNLKKK